MQIVKKQTERERTMKKEETMEIKPIAMKKVKMRIVGDTPLIVHAWSTKAKEMMLQAQQGKKALKKDKGKNPYEDCIESLYWLEGKPKEYTQEAFETAISKGARFGFPVGGLKQAAISAAYRMGWVKDKMGLRGAFFIKSADEDMFEIKGAGPSIREDMVRIGMGTADIRYRGEFKNWYADIVVCYNANGKFTIDDIANIINAGGSVCGIGEWRPERDGQNGMFHVKQ